jgi:hypothetical protein
MHLAMLGVSDNCTKERLDDIRDDALLWYAKLRKQSPLVRYVVCLCLRLRASRPATYKSENSHVKEQYRMMSTSIHTVLNSMPSPASWFATKILSPKTGGQRRENESLL